MKSCGASVSSRNRAPSSDCDRRDQQRHEQGIGCPRCRDQAEVEHVSKRRAEQGERGDRSPGRERREGVGPRAIDEHRHRQHHQRSRSQLAGRDAERRETLPAKAAGPHGGERVAERSRNAGQLRDPRASEVRQQGRADHGRDTAETEQDAGDLARAHALVVGQEMGNDHSPDRRCRIEDRCKAARDMRLSPAEQAERQRIIEKRQQRASNSRPSAAGRAYRPVRYR